MRHAVLWVVCVALLGAGVLYVLRRPLLTAMGEFLVVHDKLRPADAIVVLSGAVPDRILEAVDLYEAHLAPRLILTREPMPAGLEVLRARGGNIPEPHEENRSIAEQLGVPAAAISFVPGRVSSTMAEARAIVAYLRQQRIASILLVTSKMHTRRAGMTFRGLAGNGLQVVVSPTRYDTFNPQTWWHHRAFVRRVVIEYGKLAYYLLVDRWRAAGPGGTAG